jgi:hypothetical protein
MLAALLFVGLIILYAGGCLVWDWLGFGSPGTTSSPEPGDDLELLARMDVSSDGKLDGRL